MKPSSPEEHGDTGPDLQQDQPQTGAPDSPAKMPPPRDMSDGTGASPKKDLTHADQQPSKAKKMPTLEVLDDIASITDEKHRPKSTSVSSHDHSQFLDKATDGTPPDSDSPRSEDSFSSANKLATLDNPVGTRSSSEATSHDAESTSSGKTSLISTNANDISSTDGDRAHGSTSASLGANLQNDSKSDSISTSRPLKRKIAPTPPTTGTLPEAQGMQQSSKKMKPSTNSPSPTATESATINPGSAASISRPATSTAASQSNASAVATTPAQTQTSTNAVAAQGSASAVPTTSTQTQTPGNAVVTQGNAAAAPTTSVQTQNPRIAQSIAVPRRQLFRSLPSTSKLPVCGKFAGHFHVSGSNHHLPQANVNWEWKGSSTNWNSKSWISALQR
jgi:hypothetical protein